MYAPSLNPVGWLPALALFVLSCSSYSSFDPSEGSGGGGGVAGGGGQGPSAVSAPSSGGATSACSAGLTRCGSECVALSSNPSHCGACNLACGAAQSCVNSECTCQVGLTSCSGACVNLQGDGNNCGMCGTVCGAEELCSAGVCGTTCTVAGQTACGQSCVDLMSDELNCGGCGAPCDTGQECANGTCSCTTGLSLCNGACVDTNTSPANCGACNMACEAGQTCQNGTCEGVTAGTGGATGMGGQATAGMGTGGMGTGGEAMGGTSMGGMSMGGMGTGGEATGGMSMGGEAAGGAAGGGTAPVELPCDIYAGGNTPCVGAYSMVRLIASDYSGPLYQVRRGGPNPNTGSGGTTQDIFANAEGFADAAAQDAFCGNERCTISVLYDQSTMNNHLTVAPGGCYDGGDGAALDDDYESDAKRLPLTVGGHNVYGLYMNPHEGYRNNQAAGTAEGQESQGIYLVADGRHAGSACCWDFGTASRDICYGPTGIMNALFFGWGFWGTGAGDGPWMMGDFELGVWSGGSFPSFGLDDQPAPDPAITYNPDNPSLAVPYAFGILTTDSNNYALRMGDATSGNLTTAWDGRAPAQWDLDGAIILGIGGDNSNWGEGTFFEGAITAGRPSSTVDEAIYQNVRAAQFGR